MTKTTRMGTYKIARTHRFLTGAIRVFSNDEIERINSGCLTRRTQPRRVKDVNRESGTEASNHVGSGVRLCDNLLFDRRIRRLISSRFPILINLSLPNSVPTLFTRPRKVRRRIFHLSNVSVHPSWLCVLCQTYLSLACPWSDNQTKQRKASDNHPVLSLF